MIQCDIVHYIKQQDEWMCARCGHLVYTTAPVYIPIYTVCVMCDVIKIVFIANGIHELVASTLHISVYRHCLFMFNKLCYITHMCREYMPEINRFVCQ